MKTLTIFYDPRCGLCSKFRVWMESQPTLLRVEFLGYQSPAALERFPGLPEVGADRELVVMSDDGRWWQGAEAWITCLWATHRHHEWSFRLASPALRLFVGKAVRLLSENRLTLSSLLGMRGDAELADSLHKLPVSECRAGTCPALNHSPSIS